MCCVVNPFKAVVKSSHVTDRPIYPGQGTTGSDTDIYLFFI